MKKNDIIIWAEMARRKNKFHANEQWDKIKLWGLFSWGMVSHLIKSGELKTDMKKENRTIWVTPSPAAYEKFIKPLLTYKEERLLKMAGWE